MAENRGLCQVVPVVGRIDESRIRCVSGDHNLSHSAWFDPAFSIVDLKGIRVVLLLDGIERADRQQIFQCSDSAQRQKTD